MNEEREFIFDEEELSASIRKFESMINHKTQVYFDVHEFESIIDYYLGDNNMNRAYDAAIFANKQHPSALSLQIKKAQILINKGNSVQGLNILNKLESLESNNSDLFVLKGTAYTQLGNLSQAEKEFDKAANMNFENADDVFYNVGLIFEQARQYDKAIKYLKKSQEFDPDNISTLYDLAYNLERIGNFYDSAEYYKRYLDIDPFSENVWYNLGVVYNHLEKYEDAIEAYEFCMAIDPEYSSAYFNKANSLANKKEYNEAIQVYQEFLLLEEDNIQALCYIGECYEKLEDYDNALLYYRKVVELDDEFPDAWFGIGIVMMEKELLFESQNFIKRAIELDKNNAEYWYALGNVNVKLEFTGDAVVAYNKAISIDPFDWESWINMADLYADEGDLKTAIETLLKALENNSTQVEILYRLVGYNLVKSNMADATKYLEKAYSIDKKKFLIVELIYPEYKKIGSIMNIIDNHNN